MIFAPRLVMTWLTLSFSPRTIDEIPTTTATPNPMPSTVSDERSLLLRIVSTAMFRPSPSSPLTSIESQNLNAEYAEQNFRSLASLGMTTLSFETQRRDGVQCGCASCRIHSDKNAN